MKIVLKNSNSGLYCGEGVSWCSDVEDAVGFPSVNAAAMYGIALGLEAASVVLSHESPECELTLPLEECLGVDPGKVTFSKDQQPPP